MDQLRPSLTGLPPELRLIILELLSLDDLWSLRFTCTTLESSCLVVWTRADRRDYGFSSTIGRALYIAWTSPDKRETALQVIKREMKNGARIDEDIPGHLPQYRMAVCPIRGQQDWEWRPYTTARNLFLLGLHTEDEAILKALLSKGLPDSLSINFFMVNCSAEVATPPHDCRSGSHPFRPALHGSEGLLELLDPNKADEFCPPWVWYAHFEGSINRLAWGGGAITGLLGTSGAAADGQPAQETLWQAVRQSLSPATLQLLRQCPIVKTGVKDMSGIRKPAIPLDTLSVLHCQICGTGYVIGWFDWVVQKGNLINGTKPRRLFLSRAYCKTCDRRDVDLFNEGGMRKMVYARVGDIPDVLRVEDWIEVDKASLILPFSWFEDHFKFFLLVDSGLEPASREEILRVDIIEQCFEVSGYMFSFHSVL